MSAYFTAAVFAAAILFGFSAAAEPPGADAFGSLPRVNFGRLSPDGKHLAVIRPVDGREKIAIYDLTKKDASPYIVGMDGALAADMVWKGNDRVIGIFHANLKHKYLNS